MRKSILTGLIIEASRCLCCRVSNRTINGQRHLCINRSLNIQCSLTAVHTVITFLKYDSCRTWLYFFFFCDSQNKLKMKNVCPSTRILHIKYCQLYLQVLLHARKQLDVHTAKHLCYWKNSNKQLHNFSL